jgi:hypothetical protein
MALARNVTDVSQLSGLSLRQTYMRLGMCVEKRGTHDPIAIQVLPQHLKVAHRFLAAVPTPKDILGLSKEERERWQYDLKPVWDRLRLFFEAGDASGLRRALTDLAGTMQSGSCLASKCGSILDCIAVGKRA